MLDYFFNTFSNGDDFVSSLMRKIFALYDKNLLKLYRSLTYLKRILSHLVNKLFSEIFKAVYTCSSQSSMFTICATGPVAAYGF